MILGPILGPDLQGKTLISYGSSLQAVVQKYSLILFHSSPLGQIHLFLTKDG